MELELTPKDRDDLLALARRTIESKVQHTPYKQPNPDSIQTPSAPAAAPS